MLIAQPPHLRETPLSPTRSRFVIEPLEPGFGYTIGNALRRSLLSAIPGAAVTGVRIDGVLHEFSTVPGVREDVTELILNIKQLVVSSDRDEPVTAHLRKTGAGRVTAGDIAVPAGVAIHNPQLTIATLGYDAMLDLTLVIERGRGYVSAGQNRDEYAPEGHIAVDSIYSPVVKVAHRVEATRAGERTDFDRLTLDVETKPAMSPRDAVASAGRTLVELFGLAHHLNLDAEGVEVGPDRLAAAVVEDELDVPIEELELSVRSYNCLKRDKINTLADLVSRSEADLLRIRNFGRRSVDEVIERLAVLGLALKDSAVR